MTQEELTQAISDITHVIEAAQYLFTTINPNNQEALEREKARLAKFEAERVQYVAELKALTSQT
jgi:hypothetical protein